MKKISLLFVSLWVLDIRAETPVEKTLEPTRKADPLRHFIIPEKIDFNRDDRTDSHGAAKDDFRRPSPRSEFNEHPKSALTHDYWEGIFNPMMSLIRQLNSLSKRQKELTIAKRNFIALYGFSKLKPEMLNGENRVRVVISDLIDQFEIEILNKPLNFLNNPPSIYSPAFRERIIWSIYSDLFSSKNKTIEQNMIEESRRIVNTWNPKNKPFLFFYVRNNDIFRNRLSSILQKNTGIGKQASELYKFSAVDLQHILNSPGLENQFNKTELAALLNAIGYNEDRRNR